MNGPRQVETVNALALTLHGVRIGILAHYSGGKNILTFDPQYQRLPIEERPVFTLSQKVRADYLTSPLMASQRLPAVLSNLLPEGALRHWAAQTLKTHIDEEFSLIVWARTNLPGALIGHPLAAGDIPDWALASRGELAPIQLDIDADRRKFSLAGVQMKFSSLRENGRFTISANVGADSWIIKTPSIIHPFVPANEYTAMRLAEAIGVTIPEIELVPLNQLDHLPDIQLAEESYAYAIRRFDRSERGRIHAEDFAQVFGVYAHEKYIGKNYDQIAAYLDALSSDPLADVQQMARRLLANILLANGDAHLKNWSVIYPDQRNARLSPAYDIVTTLAYIPGETAAALNMAKQKQWTAMTLRTFEHWAERIDVPWSVIRVHLLDALDKARECWPAMLVELPMAEKHKAILRHHWATLGEDFRIG
ncbi:type II toxin-antitoxin system HipA family toxin [Serratia fonticola]|jgi:serine/threonine-protein kinase HipA|uniref:type II toxin-antitoxin system HipA family toxin n=1 Tax=Serratia fonticola TaxID=47917 RepID=UPI00192CCA37|nr:type II toxin-antitoxin system HipA family toxin [Serratia fonticola]MBL5905688.1 type II toxin-antitoxin system HipA family toxin [Serratia fonticola]